MGIQVFPCIFSRLFYSTHSPTWTVSSTGRPRHTSLEYVSMLPCETGNAHQTCWVVTGRNSRIYFTSFVAPKFARFESSWLQGRIAREGVQNTHCWSERTETATENRVDQAGWRRHYGSHLSVVSLIAPDQWFMFCTPSLAMFPHAVILLDSVLMKMEDTVEVG